MIRAQDGARAPDGPERGRDSMGEAKFQQETEQKIAEWLDQVKFRKRILGGIDEKDVWAKISELNDMYRAALIAERARYDALLQERGKGRGAK